MYSAFSRGNVRFELRWSIADQPAIARLSDASTCDFPRPYRGIPTVSANDHRNPS